MNKQIYLYGDIFSQTSCSSQAVAQKLSDLNGEDVDVHINSNGGSVYEGLAIYNLLKSYSGNVTIYIDGIAASIAGVIAMCGAPVYMSKFAQLMIHNVSGGTYGNVKDVQRMAEQMQALQDSLVDIIAKRTGLTKEEVDNRYMDGADHFLSAQEAMDLNLCTGLYDLSDDAPTDLTREGIFNFVINHNLAIMFFENLKKIKCFEACNTEEEIIAKATTFANLSEEIEKLKAEKKDLEDSLDKMHNAHLEDIVNQAVKDGKIEECNKGATLKMLQADETSAMEFINNLKAKKPATKVDDIINEGNKAYERMKGMAWDELDKSGELVNLKKDFPELYNEKFNDKFNK